MSFFNQRRLLLNNGRPYRNHIPFYMGKAYTEGFRITYYYPKPFHLIVQIIHAIKKNFTWFIGDIVWEVAMRFVYKKEYQQFIEYLSQSRPSEDVWQRCHRSYWKIEHLGDLSIKDLIVEIFNGLRNK